jgi:hypothetical protein
MKQPFFILLPLINIHLFAQDVTLSGKITDGAGNAVPFATVYVRNTTKGTSANSEGGYTLNLKPGQYDVQYRAMGYKQESRKVDLKANQSIDITFKGRRLPVKRSFHPRRCRRSCLCYHPQGYQKTQNIFERGRCLHLRGLYKRLAKVAGRAKKFWGVDVQKIARENGLDSNRRGIIYLSESQSKYSFMRPDKVHEELISSKVSGSNRAFSFNRASDLQVNFYENLQVWDGLSNRPLISPIADNALSYYKYKYIGLLLSRTAKPSTRSRLSPATIMTHVLAATFILLKIAGVTKPWPYISPKNRISTL